MFREESWGSNGDGASFASLQALAEQTVYRLELRWQGGQGGGALQEPPNLHVGMCDGKDPALKRKIRYEYPLYSSPAVWPWARYFPLWSWLNTHKIDPTTLATKRTKVLLYTHSVPFDFQVNKADEYMHLSLLSLLLLQSPERTRKECFKDRQMRKGDQYQGTRSVTCFFGKWSKLLTRGGAGEKPASSYHKPQRDPGIGGTKMQMQDQWLKTEGKLDTHIQHSSPTQEKTGGLVCIVTPEREAGHSGS